MNKSFITLDDIYLILKPFSIDLYMVSLAIILLLILIFIYKDYKDKVSKFNYILIGVLIIVNSIFIPLFMLRISNEIGRFINLSHSEAVKEIASDDLDKLYTYLDKKIQPDQPAYATILVFQLAHQ